MSKQATPSLRNIVNPILQANIKEFAKFASAKQAFDYFQENWTISELSYDNFYSYWKRNIDIATNAGKISVEDIGTEEPTLSVSLSGRINENLVGPVAFSNEPVEIVTHKAKELSKRDENDFVPMKSGKFIDSFISEDGGSTPGNVVVFVGGPSVGKTTVAINTMVHILKNNKKLSGKYFSSEYNEIDLRRDVRKKPWMSDVESILLSDYPKEKYFQVVKQVILSGEDILVIDSFQNIVEKLVAFCYMSAKQAAQELLKLCLQASKGETANGVKSFIILIQQVTKGGVFVGGNFLKHDTTAMFEFHFEGASDRYVVATKNRMNPDWQFKKLFYFVDEAKEIGYEEDRFNRELEIEKMNRDNKMNKGAAASTFNELFLTSGIYGGSRSMDDNDEDDDV